MSWNVEYNRMPQQLSDRHSQHRIRAASKKNGRRLLLVLMGSLLIGCQQLGLRPTGLYTDEDEWGAPPSNVSQVPRPYIETKRSKQPAKDSAVKASLSDQDSSKQPEGEAPKVASSPAAPATPAASSPTAVSSTPAASALPASPSTPLISTTPASAAPASAALSPSEAGVLPHTQGKLVDTGLVDTGLEDVDLDAAMEGLPPQYQEILKRQLAASKKQTVAAPSASLASNPSNESATNSSGKVSIRLSDETAESSVIAAAGKDDTNVVAASANLPKPESNPNPAVKPMDTEASSPANSTPQLHSLASQDSQSKADVTRTAESVGSSTDLKSESSSSSNERSGLTAAQDSVSNANIAWNQSVAQAILALEKQMEGAPAPDENLRLHQELTLRMLYASLRKTEEAMQPIAGLSDEENEYYRNQMMALIEASNPDAMPVRSRHLSLVMDSQRKATSFLAAASNLEVRNMSFCTDVERYGVITKFPKYQFKPDEEVLLYCEVENVSALPVKDGFESQLQGSYEILDANGNRIIEQILPMEPDVCQNVRRDYYMVYRIFMPQQISPGNYKLRLTIEDLKARKYGQSTLDLQIKK